MADLTLEAMALNAVDARRVGDELTAAYWTEAVEVASLRQQINEWDALKGSPEHG
jgi:hypothetical protein